LDRHRTAFVGSVLRVVSYLAITAVAFFMMPFIVHRLGDHLYGYWALVGAVLGYYGLLDLGIVSAVQFQVAKALGEGNPESANRSISTSVYAFSVGGFLVFLVTLVIAAISRKLIGNSPDLPAFRTVLLLVGVGSAFGFPGRALVGAISAHLRWDLISGISILTLGFRTLLVIVALLKGGGLVALGCIALLSDFLNFALYYFALRKIQADLRIARDLATLATLKELFQYGRHSFVIQISDQMRFFVDGWMVGVFVAVSAVTHYAIASRLALSFMSLMIGVFGILSPWFSHMLGGEDFKGIRRIFSFSTRVAVSLSTIIAAALILYGRQFIVIWMGQGYTDAYLPLVILVLAIYIDVAQLPSISYMLGTSRHRFLARLTLVEALSNFGLSIFWARHYGMLGVALGTLVPMVVAKLFIQPVYVCRQLNLSLLDYFAKLIGRPFIVAGLSSAFAWALLFSRLHYSNIGILALAVSGQVLFSGLVTLFFAFNPEERHSVLSRILPWVGMSRLIEETPVQ
jgi:O-antigen/teichoic acid export membrane protein